MCSCKEQLCTFNGMVTMVSVSPLCSNSSSKLSVLVNKLHEYLAQGEKDNKHKAAPQDMDGTVFGCFLYAYAKFLFS